MRAIFLSIGCFLVPFAVMISFTGKETEASSLGAA